jgi:hypothetical protein
MNVKTIIGIILIILGVLLSILSWYGPFGEGGGYIAIGIAYPLIIIGILLLFSVVGAILFLIGEVVLFLSLLLQSQISYVKGAQGSASMTAGLIWIVYGLFIIGILYGVIEGIVKLIKFIKIKK